MPMNKQCYQCALVLNCYKIFCGNSISKQGTILTQEARQAAICAAVSAVDMWNYLSELGVDQNTVHPALGKVDDQLRSYVQKK